MGTRGGTAYQRPLSLGTEGVFASNLQRERKITVTREERKEAAVGYHAQGYNCCQSVLLACRDLTGMDEGMAVALGYGFGSGMHCGEVCGAATGGLMAIGACMPEGSLQINKPRARAAAQEFEGQFREQFGTLLCREILRSNGKRICDACISSGVDGVEQIAERVKRGDE
nr:C-GCAxxG-C-C family protein [Lawsonibacter celer]